MIIISDTTPIISLLKAEHLELLQYLFGEVIIPEAVYEELVENRMFRLEAEKIKRCPFIKVSRVNDLKSVNIFRRVTGLDAGESEAIVMAEEMQADLLLIDERKGRRVAKQMGLAITGTMGILIQAYDEELLSESAVETCLSVMKKCGIRIGDSLLETIRNHINGGSSGICQRDL